MLKVSTSNLSSPFAILQKMTSPFKSSTRSNDSILPPFSVEEWFSQLKASPSHPSGASVPTGGVSSADSGITSEQDSPEKLFAILKRIADSYQELDGMHVFAILDKFAARSAY